MPQLWEDEDEEEAPRETKTLPAKTVLPGVTASLMLDQNKVAIVFDCEHGPAADAVFDWLSKQLDSDALKMLEGIP